MWATPSLPQWPPTSHGTAQTIATLPQVPASQHLHPPSSVLSLTIRFCSRMPRFSERFARQTGRRVAACHVCRTRALRDRGRRSSHQGTCVYALEKAVAEGLSADTPGVTDAEAQFWPAALCVSFCIVGPGCRCTAFMPTITVALACRVLCTHAWGPWVLDPCPRLLGLQGRAARRPCRAGAPVPPAAGDALGRPGEAGRAGARGWAGQRCRPHVSSAGPPPVPWPQPLTKEDRALAPEGPVHARRARPWGAPPAAPTAACLRDPCQAPCEVRGTATAGVPAFALQRLGNRNVTYVTLPRPRQITSLPLRTGTARVL